MIALQRERSVEHCIAIDAAVRAGVVRSNVAAIVAAALATVAADLHLALLLRPEQIKDIFVDAGTSLDQTSHREVLHACVHCDTVLLGNISESQRQPNLLLIGWITWAHALGQLFDIAIDLGIHVQKAEIAAGGQSFKSTGEVTEGSYMPASTPSIML